MNWTLIYNSMLLLLTIEEIFTVIFSISDRPFSNIILQVYPSFILIGNLGEILKSLNCQINMCGISIPQDDINIFIQILYQILIFLIFLFDLFFLLDNKTFDANKKLLLFSEKDKLLYLNGCLGGLVNAMSIIYLIRRKCYEQIKLSLNEMIKV